MEGQQRRERIWALTYCDLGAKHGLPPRLFCIAVVDVIAATIAATTTEQETNDLSFLHYSNAKYTYTNIVSRKQIRQQQSQWADLSASFSSIGLVQAAFPELPRQTQSERSAGRMVGKTAITIVPVTNTYI